MFSLRNKSKKIKSMKQIYYPCYLYSGVETLLTGKLFKA